MKTTRRKCRLIACILVAAFMLSITATASIPWVPGGQEKLDQLPQNAYRAIGDTDGSGGASMRASITISDALRTLMAVARMPAARDQENEHPYYVEYVTHMEGCDGTSCEWGDVLVCDYYAEHYGHDCPGVDECEFEGALMCGPCPNAAKGLCGECPNPDCLAPVCPNPNEHGITPCDNPGNCGSQTTINEQALKIAGLESSVESLQGIISALGNDPSAQEVIDELTLEVARLNEMVANGGSYGGMMMEVMAMRAQIASFQRQVETSLDPNEIQELEAQIEVLSEQARSLSNREMHCTCCVGVHVCASLPCTNACCVSPVPLTNVEHYRGGQIPAFTPQQMASDIRYIQLSGNTATGYDWLDETVRASMRFQPWRERPNNTTDLKNKTGKMRLTIRRGGIYVLTGDPNNPFTGQIYIDAWDRNNRPAGTPRKLEDVVLVLNGVNIECDFGPAIYAHRSASVEIRLPYYNQQQGRTHLRTVGSTNSVPISTEPNRLSDGKEYFPVFPNVPGRELDPNEEVELCEDCDQPLDDCICIVDDNEPTAVIYSRHDLIFRGTGELIVTGNHRHGIQSRDTVWVRGGKINVDINSTEEVTIDGVTFDEPTGNGILGRDNVRITNGDFEINSGNHGIRSNNIQRHNCGNAAHNPETCNSPCARVIGYNNRVCQRPCRESGPECSGYIEIVRGRFRINAGGNAARADSWVRLFSNMLAANDNRVGTIDWDVNERIFSELFCDDCGLPHDLCECEVIDD